MKTPRLLFPLLGLSLLASANMAPQAWAQPPEPPVEVAEVKSEWDKLREATSDLEATDPTKAIERYQKFYEARGRLDMRVSIQLSSLIAQLYWRGLGNRDKAIEIYNWAIPLFAVHYDSPRLTRERDQLLQGTAPTALPVVIAPLPNAHITSAEPVTPTVLTKPTEIKSAIEPIHLVPGVNGALALKTVPVGVAPVTASPATAVPGPVVIAPLVVSAQPGNATGAVTLPPFLVAAPRAATPQSVAAMSLAALPAAATPAHVTAPTMIPAAPVGVAVVNARSAVVTALVAQMRAGQLQPEPAWKNGDLNAEDVLYALQTPGVTETGSDGALRTALAGLLVRHAPEQLALPLTSSAPLKLAVADYYSSIKDAKAVPLYEQLLAQVKAPATTAPSPALDHLAAFYQAIGEYGHAADTLMRVGEFTTRPAYTGNFPVEAARLYRQAGDEAKAQAAYAEGAQVGYGWASGLVLYDQASALITQGNHEAARKLLTQPVEGLYADQIKVALLSLMSYSYYKTGELENAHRYAQQCLAQAASLKLFQGDGLEATVNVAEAVQNWSAQWEKTPIAVANENLRIVLTPQEPSEALLTRSLFVRTLRDVPLVATVDDARIQVRVTGNKQENDYFVQKEIVIEVPQSLTQSLDAVLTVSSPQLPAYKAHVPLHIEVPKPIQLSSSSVFFGEVKANEPTIRKLTLSAAGPFRVVDIKTDTSALEVQSPAPQAAKEQIITLIFTAPQVGRFYSGKIRIETDVPNEEVMEVPYIVRVK